MGWGLAFRACLAAAIVATGLIGGAAAQTQPRQLDIKRLENYCRRFDLSARLISRDNWWYCVSNRGTERINPTAACWWAFKTNRHCCRPEGDWYCECPEPPSANPQRCVPCGDFAGAGECERLQRTPGPTDQDVSARICAERTLAARDLYARFLRSRLTGDYINYCNANAELLCTCHTHYITTYQGYVLKCIDDLRMACIGAPNAPYMAPPQ